MKNCIPTTIAPNLTALLGDTIGARLLSKAGSLTNLAKYPASTVQILGAEKALFRAIKTRGNTPKYGVIYGSSFISKAETFISNFETTISNFEILISAAEILVSAAEIYIAGAEMK